MRASTTGFKLTIMEMVNTTGSLYTPEKSESKKETRFRNLCHHCHAGGVTTPLNNRSFCGEGHGIIDEVQLKGKETEDGTIVAVGDKEEVAEVKKSTIEKKRLELVPVDAADASKYLLPADGKLYVFLPDKADPFYSTLLDEMDDAGRIKTEEGTVMLVGSMCLREDELLVTLQKWNGHLCIKQVLRPEQIKEFPQAAPAQVDEKGRMLLRKVLTVTTEEFDAENFRNENRDRLAQWVEARRSGVTVDVKPTTPKKSDPNEDWTANLEAALAVVKAKQSA